MAQTQTCTHTENSSEKSCATSEAETYTSTSEKSNNGEECKQQAQSSHPQTSSETTSTTSSIACLKVKGKNKKTGKRKGAVQNQGPKSEPSNSSGESAAADSSSAGEQYLNDKDTSSSTESHKSSSKHECSSAAKQPLGHADDDARAETAGRVWSISEDELLRGIKNANDGLSWEDIGKILNVSKGDAKARWKKIRNALADDGGQQSSEPAPASAIATSDKTTAETNDCNEKEDKSTKPNTEETGKEDSASDSSSSLSLPGGTGIKESRRQKRYWRKHIHSHLYPALIEPEPDAHFSKSDCEVLASIDSQYKASRWLEMQANFYNVTGRMVPLQVIRNKCEDAEQGSMDTSDARNITSRRRKSIEEWVGNIISHLKTDLEALPK